MSFVFCLTNSNKAQNFSSIEESASKLESEAENISKDWNSQSIRRYIDLNSEAAEFWKETNNPQKQAECYRKVAKFESLLGNNEVSLINLKKALAIENSESIFDGKIKTLSLLLNISLKIGQKSESEKFLQESIRLSNATTNPVSRAMSAHSTAEFYYFQRDFISAEKFYKQSIEQWQKTENISDYAQTLVDYGYFYMTNNELAKSLELLKQAENKFLEIKDQRGLALSRIAIGHLYVSIDRNQSALKFYELADKNFPDDTDFIERARLYNGIGLVYEDFGEWNLSLNYRRKALNLFKKDNYLQGQLTTLPSIVKLSYLTENPSAAEEYFAEIKRISAILNEKFYLAITQKQIGDFYFNKQSDKLAIDNYRKSLGILEVSNSKSDIALIKNNFGTIYKRQKNYPLARNYYETALKISREVQDKFAEAEILYNLADLFNLENRDEKALELIQKSVELTEEITSDVFNAKLTRTYFSNTYERFGLYIKILMKFHKRFPEKDFALTALQASEKSRSRSLIENLRLTETEFMQDADPEIVRREMEVRNLLSLKSNKLTDFLSSNTPKAEIDKLTFEIEELTDELENIKALLKQKSPLYSVIRNPPDFDIKDFQKNILDEDSLFLEFFLGKEESFLWIIGKNEFQVLSLPNHEILDSQIKKLRNTLVISRTKLPEEEIDQYQARIALAEKEFIKDSQNLSNRLFGQIADKIARKRLIIVPDGELHYFPIAALPFPNQNDNFNEPFLLTNEIIYQSSAMTLSLLRNKLTGNSAKKGGLVFADPVFSLEDERLSNTEKTSLTDIVETINPFAEKDFRSSETLKKLSRLEASKKESESIMEIIGDKNSALFSDFSANREQFLALPLNEYKIIHFATHSILNAEKPDLSAIVLSQFDNNGINRNGFIRLHDIYGLNLSADIVVLSACDTGIGKEIKGEGLMSLANGFLQVGAKSVISSSWKVNDEATFLLMKDFYEEIAKNEFSYSESLRKAQIRIRENPKYKSPFYWAAFTFYGDFQRKPQFNKNFEFSPRLIICFAVSIFAVAFVLFRISKKLKLFNKK